MFKWKLVEGINEPQKYRLYETSESGVLRFGYKEFYPNKEYRTDNEGAIKAVKELRIKRLYSTGLEEQLKQNGIEYDIEVCHPCGGRKKYLKFNPFEEVK